MIKNILFILVILLSCTGKTPAQEKNVIGHYHFPDKGGDGLGGSTIVIMENQKFALVAYATLIAGVWEISKSDTSTLILQPIQPEGTFQVFGRKNPDLHDEIQIIFTREADGEIYFGTQSIALKRLFNEGANCFCPPYIYSEKKLPEALFFADLTEPQKQIFNRFSTSGYNEFVVKYFSENEFYPEMKFAIIQNGIKTLDDFSTTEAKKMPMTKYFEELDFFSRAEEIVTQTVAAKEIFLNTDFKGISSMRGLPNLSAYRYDAQKNMYTAKQKTDAPDEYYKRDVLLKFEKINPANKKTPYSIIKGNIFTAECKYDE